MEAVRYLPIINDGDCREDPCLEKGLTPVDTSPLSNGTHKKAERTRTISVNSVTQTENGSIVKIPRLHIPGETGELAGLSAEMASQDFPDGQTTVVVTPEKLKQIYSQVRAMLAVSLFVLQIYYIFNADAIFANTE